MNLPDNIKDNAAKATNNLLPIKSRELYDKEYHIFMEWKLKNHVTCVNETVILAYFQELSEKYSPNSLWTKYSIIKSTLIVHENNDISRFPRLISFLKIKSKGYTPKKSKVLEGDQVLSFINNAPDEIYLLHKVVLVMGVFGGLRRDELVKMTIDDIEDKGTCLLVKVPVTKTSTSKGFTIVEEDRIGALKLVKKYISLRPKGIKEQRFFLTYRNNRCTVQPVGKNTIGSVPSIIAKYLKLEKPNEYTGHCLRRTSSTLLVEAGASFEILKMHGKWKSSSVAEGYVEESISSKNRVSSMILDSVTASNESPVACRSTGGQVFPLKGLGTSENFAANNFSGKFENCIFNFGK